MTKPSTPDHTDPFDQGLRNRRAMLGDAWVDRSLSNANAFNADFQSLITRYAWHDIWGRPGLDHRTRRLLVLGMTIAQGRWEEYELHLRAAVAGGIALDEIKETLLQSAIYCGVPAANTAFKLALDLFKQMGVAIDPQPLTPEHRVSAHRTFSTPELHVLRQGQGTPVVLSHALGMDVHLWDGLARALAAQGCEVLRYDHRGHGQSASPAGPYAMNDLVDDAARVVREWGRGPVVWIGLSMGGMVGQGLAARHPDLVKALVIANSTSWYPEAAQGMWAQRIATVESQGLAAIADAVMGRYFHEDFRAAHPEAEAAARATLLRTDPAGYVACCHAVAKVDWREALPTIACPVLVIAGARDQGAPVAMSEAIVQARPGAKLVVLENASHISVMEEPRAFEQTIREFLGSL